MHNFTPEDLLEFAYDESSSEKAAAIKAALEHDWSLREKLELIISAKKELETLSFSPRPNAIEKIMSHAEKSAVELHTH
jgi:hypothetical protein